MATETEARIFIGGQAIEAFHRFTLIQEIDAHHEFELVCRKDVLETNATELVGGSKDFLGQVFVIEIAPTTGFSKNEILQFKGIVSAIHVTKGFHQPTGDLIRIKGKSCSIIADDGPNYTSHNNVGLSDILGKTFSVYNKSILQISIDPEKNSPILYSVQHEESAFAYASRLAAQYGEWFYYNGTNLVFGKPERSEPVKLEYGHNLVELSMNIEPAPNQFNYMTNDYLSDVYHEKKTKDISQSLNGVNGFVRSKSENLFPNETQVFVSSHDDAKMKSRLDNQILKQKLSNEVNQVKVNGISTNPQIQVGSIVNISEGGSSHGEYRIIKIVHNCKENGRYQNEFVAITADTDIYPKTSIKSFPKSQAQTAVVVDNVDPKGMGRVKIQYAWQKKSGETTDWVRQSSLSGGAGQGMYFVPEKGDEVVVGYEGGNAEAPIVQGSVTNASSVPADFKSGDNHLKAIKTRSGNQVTLNDADGSITIADPSGNTIVMSGSGEITISAPNKITFSSKDIALDASNDLTVNAGNNITTGAANEISTSAGTGMQMDAGVDMKMVAGTDMKMDAGSNMAIKAGAKATMNGTKSVSIFGKRVSVTGSVMANIQSGVILTVITAGVITLSGAASGLINSAKLKLLGGKINCN